MKKTKLPWWQKLIVAVLAVFGMAVMAYPFVSDYLNSLRQAEVISGYLSTAASESKLEQDTMLQAAREYNERLLHSTVIMTEPFTVDAFQSVLDSYDSILAVNDVGMMGFIDIPAIGVHLPIYHGTGTYALQHGVGHLQTTSFPIGGESTHAVLSAHSGLPQSAMFSDLDELAVGDTFCITILSNEVWYQVYDTVIVLPEEVSSLYIQEGRDLCTLVTCTPIGINSHRLLVMGERIEAPESDVQPADMPPENEAEPQETGSADTLVYILVPLFNILCVLGIICAIMYIKGDWL